MQTASHINKRLCKSAHGSAHEHAALHSCMSPMHLSKAPCLFAEPFVYVHRRVFMCTSGYSYARPSVRLQAPLHLCTTRCLLAAGPACMHGGVFICKGAVYRCRASCWSPRVCACLQSRVFICTSTCTREVRTRREAVLENLRKLSACLKFHQITFSAN